MISGLPKLRTDLIISRQQAASGTFFIVKDPVSERFYRFGEVEQFIAEHLDAETPLDVVRERAEERFGAVLAPETLSAFVRHLEDNGLLETGEAKERKRRRGRIRGSVLYLRFALLDPDRLITHIARRLGFFFTAFFLLLSSSLILLAMGVIFTHGSEITIESTNLLRASTVPLAMLVLLVTISAHEFAHGATCKHFGGEVHEMGFMLLYFQPALYCNVSDAWLFPEKAKRLWVSFAGMYFELFLWALATLSWRLTEADTAVHHLALIVMTVSGIKSLLNLNPFIKLDGYYLLSDWVDIPNLRRKSFRYVGGMVQRVLGVGTDAAGEVTRRERRLYLAYGAVATVVSLSFLAYAFITAGKLLVEIRQPGLLALLTGFVGLRTNRYYKKLFGKASDPLDPEDGGDDVGASRSEGTAEKSAERPERNPKSSKDKTRKVGRSVMRQFLWLSVMGAIVALLFSVRMQLRIPGPVNVLPQENADVRAEVEGIIDAILVDEGDQVAAGDVIARLSDRTQRAELAKIEAEIRETRAALSKLEAGPMEEEIAVARAAVVRALDRLMYAQTRLERLQGLLATNTVPRQEVEVAQEQATTAENDLAESRARLDVLLRGSRTEDIAATRARIDRMQTQRQYLEEQVRLLEVVSPASGIVATPSRQLMLLPGQLVGKGALIAKVYDFRTVDAQIVVAEKDIGDVRVGQRVILRTRAYPEVQFDGTVTTIATSAEGTTATVAGASSSASATPSRSVASRTFLVTTSIDNSSLLLKPGMTGQAKVLAGERRIIDLITRRLFRTLKVEVWSWW